MQEITLPSWAQQGQKERGLRRGVPALGSTSIEPKMGEEERKGRGSWKWRGREEEKQGENKQTSKRTKKHKSEKERKQQEEVEKKIIIQEMEKQKQGEQSTDGTSFVNTNNGEEQTVALGGETVWATKVTGIMGKCQHLTFLVLGDFSPSMSHGAVKR